MASQSSIPSREEMQRFSATGRPFVPRSKQDKQQGTLSNMDVADTPFGGGGPVNTLPRRYTDDTLIPVPVMRPEDVAAAREARQFGPPESTTTTMLDGSEKKKSGLKGLFTSRRASKDNGANERFVLKQLPRGVYLKHYAKDDDGRYCGEEDPAEDCILRGADVEKWRGNKNGLVGTSDSASAAAAAATTTMASAQIEPEHDSSKKKEKETKKIFSRHHHQSNKQEEDNNNDPTVSESQTFNTPSHDVHGQPILGASSGNPIGGGDTSGLASRMGKLGKIGRKMRNDGGGGEDDGIIR